MSFSFVYHVREKLPKLAWLAQVDSSRGIAEVYCGTKVERHEAFFVTGVWDGEYLSADFDSCDAFYGTGAKLTQDGVLFVTPSHALERVVLAEREGKVIVSNSLPFLMEHIGAELDRKICSYESIMCSMLNGPDGIQDIPLSNGDAIKQFIVSNILVTEQGIKPCRRPVMKPFVNFEDYYTRITASLEAIRRNIEAPERSARFGLVSTISSGYDSSACCALARTIGCERIVALSGGQYDKDDGTSVAEMMGYTDIQKRDKNLYKSTRGCIDALYVSSGDLGTELQFSVFDDLFEDNLVFIGSRGSYWNKSFDVTDDFEMKGYYYFETSVSYTEDMLRLGAVYAPLPAFGASVASSIKRVSNSEEMRPWSVGGSYDKPIPRRIVESVGVPREAFGMKKYGGGFSFGYDNMSRIKRKMSTEGFESFAQFRKQHKGSKNGLHKLGCKIKYGIQISPVYFNLAMGKMRLPFKIKQKPLTVANPGAPADLIFWGIDYMKARYSEAMA